jgi:predicted unusual protein kinase regulating ubiquinone biosynthesis (AarF/ABC1/UbiB family)
MRTSVEARSSLRDRRDQSPIAEWMIGVMRIARVHGLRVPPMIVSIYRALLVAETVGSRLDPSADLRSVGRRFFDRLQTDEALKAIEPSSLQPVALNYLSLLRDGPGQLNQILAEISEGTFAITVYTVEPPRLARMRNRRVVAIILAILSLGPVILLAQPDLPDLQGVPLAWPLLALLLVLYLSIFLVIRRLR